MKGDFAEIGNPVIHKGNPWTARANAALIDA